MQGILVGRLGSTWGHHATLGRATCSVSDSQGLLEEKPLRFLLPMLPPGSSEHAKVTFTNLKAPLFFLLPFSVSKALGITAFLDMVIWTNILAEIFSLLWKYPPCGEQS